MPSQHHQHNPRWCLTCHVRDLPLAQSLQRRLGGFIRYKVREHAVVLIISRVPQLVALLVLTAGCYRSPKIRQVHALTHWLNTHHGSGLPRAVITETGLLRSAWLAGFIDADGSFGLRLTVAQGSTRRRTACRFRLEQRTHDPISGESYGPLLIAISNSLGGRYGLRVQAGSGRTYGLVTTDSVVANTRLVRYLTDYPLFTSKRANSLIWTQAHAKLKSKLAYDPRYTDFMVGLKKSINRGAPVDETHLQLL